MRTVILVVANSFVGAFQFEIKFYQILTKLKRLNILDQSEDLSYVAVLMGWEITPDSLKVLEINLGKGQFGIVKQGLLTTGVSDSEVVAVKMLKGKKFSFNQILLKFLVVLTATEANICTCFM